MMPPIIRVNNLTAGFADRIVLRDISFDVQRGEVFVIAGGSGSGKSTLLKHMIGLYRPQCGTVCIEGKDIVAAHGPERLSILRKIGVSFQTGALFGSMSILDNVRLPLEAHTDLPKHATAMIARMKLQLVSLGDAADRMPVELSGGMRKRAAIARAMALDPLILFLDEPSAGLDPVLSAELDALLLNLSRVLHVTMVVVTHELDSIFTIADRVLMLDGTTQTIAAEGPLPKLLAHANPQVRRFFAPNKEQL